MARAGALVLGAGLAMLALAPAAPASLRFRRCAPYTAAPAARCATLRVPLDRTGAVRGTLSLPVQRIVGTSKRGGVLLVLSGVDAEGFGSQLAGIADALDRKIGGRTLVSFPARFQPGRRGPTCPRLERAAVPTPGLVAACARQLGRRRGPLGVAGAAGDVESVRAALKAERVDILAAGYDALTALAYAAAHPDRVGRIVLDAPAAPGGPDPLGTGALAASRRSLRRTCRKRACRKIRASPERDLAALAARARAGRLSGPLVGADGRARTVRVGPRTLEAWATPTAVDFLGAGVAPGLLHAARAGDPAPLTRSVAGKAASAGPLPFLADLTARTTFAIAACPALAVPWAPGASPARRRAALRTAAAALPSAAFAPFGRAAVLAGSPAAFCAGWPESGLAAPDPATVPAPTLVLAGSDDAQSPEGGLRRLAARLPHGTFVEVRGGGHGSLADGPACAAAAAATFLHERRVGRACAAPAPTPGAPPPRTLGAVPGVAGLGGRRGRTVVAAALTLFDALASLLTRPEILDGALGGHVTFGALRGGRYVLSRKGLRVEHAEYVPGVVVDATGESPSKAALRMDVSGPAAAHGTVSLGDRYITGRLDGRRFRIKSALVDALLFSSVFGPLSGTGGGTKPADPGGGQRAVAHAGAVASLARLRALVAERIAPRG